MRNVKEAVAKGHTLIVYYFKGEVGEGKVTWADVTAQSLLRDEVLKRQAQHRQDVLNSLSPAELHCLRGLGGSQKAEVAWLDKMGYQYEELDVSAFIDESANAPHTNDQGIELRITATAWRTKVNALLQLAKIAELKRGFLEA